MRKEELDILIKQAVEGDKIALEKVLMEVNDFVFNLSLRMLGNISDAQDATQDILMKIMMKLSTFQNQSHFHTWVYRLASHYLIDYKKSMFAKHPLNFEFYANDIQAGYIDSPEELIGLNKEVLAKELKLSCTNVMLQCLDPMSRCVFILGTMFKINSQLASEILDISAQNYRQILSRSRKKMRQFLSEYCGLSGSGCCQCERRLCYAMKQHRLDPSHLEYLTLQQLDESLLEEYLETMERFDDEMNVFEQLPQYQSQTDIKEFISHIVHSAHMKKMMEKEF
ncbi:RNA polymerase sigma factor [Longibaculum muris]|uniref:RNA polymerase sigma factor n=1 Tax=Longibaculum muris TaxID=1796628 RepID=UPI0012B851D8|nr:RNA polymerase sigma factor [Longibaculum muris]